MKVILVTALLSTLAGCALQKKDDNKKSKNDNKVDINSLWINKANLEKDAIALTNIKSGDYIISEILTNYDETNELKFRSAFYHRAKEAGQLAKVDSVKRAVDFSKVDLEKYELYPVVEINLPLAIRSENKEVSFLNRHYYWNQNRSDGSWGWLQSAELSPKGDQFHQHLTQDNFTDGLYKTEPNVWAHRIAIHQESDDLRFTVEITDSDSVSTYQLTYKKVKLHSVKNKNSAADKKEVKPQFEDKTVVGKKSPRGTIVDSIPYSESMDGDILRLLSGVYKSDLMAYVDYVVITPNSQIIGLEDDSGTLKLKYRDVIGSEKLLFELYDDGSIWANLDGRRLEMQPMNASSTNETHVVLLDEIIEAAVHLSAVTHADGFEIEVDFPRIFSSSAETFSQNQVELLKYLTDNWSSKRLEIKASVANFDDWANLGGDQDISHLNPLKKIRITTNSADSSYEILHRYVMSINDAYEKQYYINVPNNADMSSETFSNLLNEGLQDLKVVAEAGDEGTGETE